MEQENIIIVGLCCTFFPENLRMGIAKFYWFCVDFSKTDLLIKMNVLQLVKFIATYIDLKVWKDYFFS